MTRTTFRRITVAAAVLVVLATVAFAQAEEATKVPDAENFVGKPQGMPLTGDELNRQTQEIGSSIRCPVCQGLSIADSPSEMAVNMKAQVHELLKRGYTREQILSYFERSYGQFVLLKPKFQGVNTLVWILPIAGLALGAWVVMVKLRNLGSGPVAATAPDAAAAPEAPVAAAEAPEDPYLARVRELVKGDTQ